MKTFGIVMLVIFCLALISVFGFMGTTCNNAQNQVQEHVVNNSFNSYEEFQEIYNTCKEISDNLCNIKDVKDTDPVFKDFSKSAQQIALRAKMNRWIRDYNGKSKMWNRAMWKSKDLPYQLEAKDFDCY